MTVSRACLLSSAEPDAGPWRFKGEPSGGGHNAERMLQSMQEAAFDRDYFINLRRSDVEEITDLYNKLSSHRHDIVDLQSVISQFEDLKALPRKSMLRFLGYFGIVESLLTHAPKQSDPYDSITRQIKKKLLLLNNRFPTPIDYTLFGGASAEAIWGKMYEYGSKVLLEKLAQKFVKLFVSVAQL